MQGPVKVNGPVAVGTFECHSMRSMRGLNFELCPVRSPTQKRSRKSHVTIWHLSKKVARGNLAPI
jgi:hypothetical protein